MADAMIEDANVRIMDARALTFPDLTGTTADHPYVAAGDGWDATGGTPAPVRVHRVRE
jgi:hypothetical protein